MSLSFVAVKDCGVDAGLIEDKAAMFQDMTKVTPIDALPSTCLILILTTLFQL